MEDYRNKRNKNVRLAVMTEQEVRDIVTDAVETALRTQQRATTLLHGAEERDTQRYVYGIKGIMDLFGCSRSTAAKYKSGLLKKAVSQHGRKITIDVRKARELFKNKDNH